MFDEIEAYEVKAYKKCASFWATLYVANHNGIANLHMLANCCVWKYTLVEKSRLDTQEFFGFPQFKSVFVHIETSNMAAWFYA